MSANERSLNQTNVSRSLNRSNSRAISWRQNCSDCGGADHDEDRGGVGEKHQDVVDHPRQVQLEGDTRLVDASALGSFMKRASAAWMIGVVGNSCSPYFCTNSADVPAIDTTRSNRRTAVVVASHVVHDEIFTRNQVKRRRPDGHLEEVDGLRRLPAQFRAEALGKDRDRARAGRSSTAVPAAPRAVPPPRTRTPGSARPSSRSQRRNDITAPSAIAHQAGGRRRAGPRWPVEVNRLTR